MADTEECIEESTPASSDSMAWQPAMSHVQTSPQEDGKDCGNLEATVIGTPDGLCPPEDKSSIHVGVQAYDYEIERIHSALPARRRLIPFKFRDYQDPDVVVKEDPDDMEYMPRDRKYITGFKAEGSRGRGRKVGRPRGRPRKVVRDHTYQIPGAGEGESSTKPDTEGQTVSATTEEDGSECGRGKRKPKGISFDEESLTRKRSFRCNKEGCGQTFMQVNTLLKHESTMHPGKEGTKELRVGRTPKGEEVKSPKPFKCTKCDKSFTQKGNLKSHDLVHSGLKPYACDVTGCEKVFRSVESLKRHKQAHMGVKPFECELCNKKCSSNLALKEHMLRHIDARPYQCPHCTRAFRQTSCYKRHLLTHSDDKPFACDVCGKKFSQLTYVRSHMAVHTGEKPFKCEQCGKQFAHRSDKNRHMITHTGVKPYACRVCGARFSDASSCRRHSREHEGYKPYNCSLCTETFKRSGQLKAHLNKKHTGQQGKADSQASDTSGVVYKSTPANTVLRLTDGVAVEGFVTSTGTLVLGTDDKNVSSQAPPQNQQQQVSGLVLQEIIKEAAESTSQQQQQQEVLLTDSSSNPKELSLEVQQQILQQLQQHSPEGALLDSDGQPLQVAYQVIHDDENQQVVEIQYQYADQVKTISATSAHNPVVFQTDGGQLSATHTVVLQENGGSGDEELSNVENLGGTGEISVVQQEHIYQGSDQQTVQEGESHEYSVSQEDLQSTSTVLVEGIQEESTIVEADEGENNGVDVQAESGQVLVEFANKLSQNASQLQENVQLNHMLNVEGYPGEGNDQTQDKEVVTAIDTVATVVDDLTSVGEGTPCQVVEDNTSKVVTTLLHIHEAEAEDILDQSNSVPQEGMVVTQASENAANMEQSESVTDSEVDVKATLLSLEASSGVDFVQNPDFNSQEYYNWLSSFTELAKILTVPLDIEIFQKISHVCKSLSDILANPQGVLSDRENFVILMTISQDLSSIVNSHLTHVLSHLREDN